MEISKIGLGDWYSSLSDRDKVKTERYLKDADTSSAFSFLYSAASASVADGNHQFAAMLLDECFKRELTDTERFDVTELLIDAYMGMKRYDDAKLLCEQNLLLYPSVSSKIKERNGGSVPEKLNCRNRYIDITAGIESGYDEAFGLLGRFLEMRLITEEEYKLRMQSLRIHRLQRSFDGIYTYSFKK